MVTETLAMLLYSLGILFFVVLPPVLIFGSILIGPEALFAAIKYMVFYSRSRSFDSLVGGLLRRKHRFFEESREIEKLMMTLEPTERRVVNRISGIVFFVTFAYVVLSVLLMGEMLAFLGKYLLGS